MFDKTKAAGDTAALAAARARIVKDKPNAALTETQAAKFQQLPVSTTQPIPLTMSRGQRNDPASIDLKQADYDDAGKEYAAIANLTAQTRPRTENREVVVRSTPFEPFIKDNPLHEYVNYTYGLSLHYMTVNKFNRVVADGEKYSASDQAVLIASGGRQTNELVRNKFFRDTNYTIESLRMTTVIGHNARTRGTNAIQVEFTVLEPFGMTLIERFIRLSKENKITSWDELPLMLQIDFFGNFELGEENKYQETQNKIKGTTKYIPIKLIDCKLSVSYRGSEYRFTAIPMNHTALLQNNATIPVTIQVVADTIGDFFSSERKGGDSFETGGYDAGTGAGEFGSELPVNVKVESFVQALNSYQRRLVTEKEQQHADVYEFRIHKKIQQVKILNQPQTKTAAGRTPMNAQNQETVDPNLTVTNINPGTSVVEVINQVLRQSEYFRNLVNERQEESAPIDIFKIITQVRLGKYDNIRKTFAKRIIFYIQPFSMHNQKYPYAKKSVPATWIKQYQYFNTGLNQDVLDFKLDYNVMFFTALTSTPERLSSTVVQGIRNDSDKQSRVSKDQLISNYGDPYSYNRYQHVSANQYVNSNQQSNLDPIAVRAGDLFNSIMSTSRGDMINVDLKISGDPDFIKQDDVFLSPLRAGNRQINSLGSINMDAAEIHVYLALKQYSDIDQTRGIMVNELDRSSGFSGIYKVIQVENNFDHGQFTQTLGLIRLPEIEPFVPSDSDLVQKRQATSE